MARSVPEPTPLFFANRFANQPFFWFGSGSRKGGRVEFKGGSLHDGFGGFDGRGLSVEHVALLLLVLQNTAQ